MQLATEHDSQKLIANKLLLHLLVFEPLFDEFVLCTTLQPQTLSFSSITHQDFDVLCIQLCKAGLQHFPTPRNPAVNKKFPEFHMDLHLIGQRPIAVSQLVDLGGVFVCLALGVRNSVHSPSIPT